MDIPLIDRLLAGDSKAATELYYAYCTKITRYLKKKLPEEEVQDVLNDIFFEVIDTISLLQKKEKFGSWLYQIAHNKVVDFYRKKKAKTILMSQIPFFDFVDQEVHQPEFQYEKKKIKERIEIALHTLSEPYRKILQLHYEEHIPVKRLAVLFHLSDKATESLLFRARKSFQRAYERTHIS